MFPMINLPMDAWRFPNTWLASGLMIVSRKWDYAEHVNYCTLVSLHTPIDYNQAYHEQHCTKAFSLFFSSVSNHLIHNHLHNRRTKAPNYLHEEKYFSSWKKIIIFMKKNIFLHEDNSVMMFYWEKKDDEKQSRLPPIRSQQTHLINIEDRQLVSVTTALDSV